MLINLHKNATTTPAIREAIQNATGSDDELARPFNVTRDTIRQWRKRDTVADGSHTPHRLQSTLNAGQAERVIYLRTPLRLPLDDLLAVVREFIEPAMSRSALDRRLRRRGHSRLPVPEKAERANQPFKAYEPGYVPVDVKYLPQRAGESARRYVFVAIKNRKTAAAAQSFLNALTRAAPFRMRTLLTDNGKAFTDRLFGKRAQDASGKHEFDALCEALGIEHRLTRPRTPQTNGRVERFNGRLEQVLRSHHFNSAEDLEKTLLRYVWLYHPPLPQKALNHEAPIQAMKRWQQSHPHLFQKSVRNHPGPDRPADPGDASGQHAFDALGEALGIDHRLTQPRTPQTNGRVERFNGRLEQGLRTPHVNSAEDLEQTRQRYVWLYHPPLPQKALNHETPLQALKRWRDSHPQLFSKGVRNYPGPDK